MFYMCQRFTTNQYKDKRKGSKQRSKVIPKAALGWRTGLSGVPPDNVRCTTEQCPVHHQTVSGAPGRNDSEPASFGNSGSHSAIIHQTVWCNTGLSGVPAEQQLLRANGRLQRNSESEQCAPTRAEVRAGARRRTGQ
jgi:hypothetical protein